ncbi:pseudouridine synthase [Aristaeella hokkaidonensis]|uniref:RluA family pseudouridine synthase n=1 Tax=Aristaeella hokkaidonensis TaxID=3046382 RepID=A0AC61MXR2_9FIRM|nr:RluA family pseudouridine synthase [Aristaeella hokkaidonensis]QUC67775.1 RluA family pseudouridine synthase [Aristaeella hokkaidonensis]SNT92828.1 23S rRNA pseudouridine955/2504/2580 synthase [Aristaeella hokkaidonensis]
MPLKEIIIPRDAVGQRVADYLRSALPDLPESVLRRIFASRDVKLDGVRVSRDQRLQEGQCLKVYIPDTSSGSFSAAPSLPVVYEDDDVLLVNKRAGISVEPDARGGVTLTNLCQEYVRRTNPDAFPPAACHRLDNKTCGLCLFAKNQQALDILQDVFRSRKLEKYYVCLVRGIMKPPEAVCHAWLVKDALHARVRITDHQEPGAKPVSTGYETLESGPVSRLRVHLITGRTHQIRAHLAALGHPLLGDDLYGDRDFNRREKARSLKLCAVSLTIDTDGRLPALDGKTFTIDPPF